MAENNTNLFLEILHSFDAGEYFFLTSLLFLAGLFHVVSLIGTIVLSGIQALITSGIDTICDYF